MEGYIESAASLAHFLRVALQFPVIDFLDIKISQPPFLTPGLARTRDLDKVLVVEQYHFTGSTPNSKNTQAIERLLCARMAIECRSVMVQSQDNMNPKKKKRITLMNHSTQSSRVARTSGN